MSIEDRMEKYREMISQEANPALKRLYEVNLSLLQELKLKRSGSRQGAFKAPTGEKGEEE